MYCILSNLLNFSLHHSLHRESNFSNLLAFQPEEMERYWFVFILYSIKRLGSANVDNTTEGADQNKLTLSHALRALKLKYNSL